MSKTDQPYKPNRITLSVATRRVSDGNSLAEEAIAVAKNISRLTQRGELELAHDAAELAAKSAQHAAAEYTRVAEALKLEVYRKYGGSVVSSGVVLHNRERDAREADKIPNCFCRHLG